MLVSPRSARTSRLWICNSCTARLAVRSKSFQRNFSRINRNIIRKLPTTPARTRFAPSPTGYLHLGSLRTALFNFLLAKATGGQFLLRIEDTDRKRTIPDAEERLYQDLRWAGLQWDEGRSNASSGDANAEPIQSGPEVGGQYGPYRQSERTPLYREHADKLLHSGHAYRCFCSPERLDALTKQRNQLGLPTDYDRTCLTIPAQESADRAAQGEAHVVRLKVPDQYPEFTDIVYGHVGKQKHIGAGFRHGEPAFEDPILLKSDGLPTYHLANVVDDHYMKITHVVRAAEWITSTPKHLVMYEAFGWQAPGFAHVGLLQDQDRQKLSKRNFDLSIRTLEEQLGIIPDALVNFVALLGWSHGKRSDFFTLQELIDNFDMKFTKGNTIVTFGKLWHLQKNFAQRYAEQGGKEFDSLVDRVYRLAARYTKHEQLELVLQGRNLKVYLASILRIDAKNFSTVEDFYQRNAYFFKPVSQSRLHPTYDHNSTIHGVPSVNLVRAANMISEVDTDSWNVTSLHAKIAEALTSHATIFSVLDDRPLGAEAKPLHTDQRAFSKALHSYLRWALAEGMPGPGMGDMLTVLGRTVTLSRLSAAANSLREQSEPRREAGIPQSEAIAST